MTDVIQVISAIDSEDGAQKIAETLVSQRLAASVHIIGPITSMYWWRGKMEIAREWVCVAKTRQTLYNRVENAILEIHPYDLPGILAIPVLDGRQEYLQWIVDETIGE